MLEEHPRCSRGRSFFPERNDRLLAASFKGSASASASATAWLRGASQTYLQQPLKNIIIAHFPVFAVNTAPYTKLHG